jgi:hypothetical protein
MTRALADDRPIVVRFRGREYRVYGNRVAVVVVSRRFGEYEQDLTCESETRTAVLKAAARVRAR